MVRVLERGLRTHGFEVTAVEPSAAISADNHGFGIVVADLGPASPRGQALAAGLGGSVPVLFLVAADGHDHEHVLRKPFAMEELIARVHRLTRSADRAPVTTLTAGDLRLDLLARCAWHRERLIDLPAREFALLEYFMRHPRRVLNRHQILADVWGYHMPQTAGSSNVVDVYVRYLRNRLQGVGDRRLIATVRGAGYQFNPPAEAGAAPPPVETVPAPLPRSRDQTTKAPLRRAK